MMSFHALVAELVRTSPGIYPNPRFKEQLNRLKYIIRGLWMARDTASLMELLADSRLQKLRETYPRIVSKVQWPFISSRYHNAEKISALRAHYAFFTGCLPASIQEALSTGQNWPLVSIPLEQETIGVVLRQANYEKEGELAISLLSLTTQELICTITFTIATYSSSTREIVIGGLQGHDFSDDKARIISITRSLKGLRPKALMLFALQQFAATWDCTALHAVGNTLHIYSSARKRKDLAADYDAFWEESGGVLGENGFFTLPVIPPVRDIAEIKPNKRSTYRQRYALLESLGEQIRASLSGKQTAANPSHTI
jgi:uncharacterized protein VirK/YbjX